MRLLKRVAFLGSIFTEQSVGGRGVLLTFHLQPQGDVVVVDNFSSECR